MPPSSTITSGARRDVDPVEEAGALMVPRKGKPGPCQAESRLKGEGGKKVASCYFSAIELN